MNEIASEAAERERAERAKFEYRALSAETRIAEVMAECEGNADEHRRFTPKEVLKMLREGVR